MSRPVISALFLCGALALAPGTALAHGPTVQLDADTAEPSLLEIERAQTVHFVNRGDTTVRVRGDDDAFRSPELVPGGAGWHLPFPFPGRFGYSLEGESDVRGTIVVTPAE
jgi:hypothetical protein